MCPDEFLFSQLVTPLYSPLILAAPSKLSDIHFVMSVLCDFKTESTLSTQLYRQVRHCPLLCNNADENPQFRVNLSEDENESAV